MISHAIAPPTVAHRNPTRPQPTANVAAATATRMYRVGDHQRAVLGPPADPGERAEQCGVQTEPG